MSGYKFIFLLLASTILTILVVSIVDATNIEENEGLHQQVSKGASKLLTLLNWERYKEKFHKSYKSIKEELVRKKLHLLSGLKAFMHNILFNLSKTTYYLALTLYADWTPSEINAMYKYTDSSDSEKNHDVNEKERKSIGIDGVNQQVDVSPSYKETFASAKNQRIISNKESGFMQNEMEMGQIESGRQEDGNRKKRSIEDKIDKIELQRTPSELGPVEAVRLPISTDHRTMREEEFFDSQESSQDNIHEIPQVEPIFDDSDESPFDIDTEDSRTPWSWLTDIFFKQNTQDNLDTKEREKNLSHKDSRFFTHPPSIYNFISQVPKFVTDYVWPDQLADHTLVDKFHDWRSSGCITIPRHQYNCGCCYAFATVAFLEWFHCRNTGKLMPFSEQYMVDCGVHVSMSKCKGGTMEALESFVRNYGVDLRENYPYKAANGTCPFEKDAKLTQVGYTKPTIELWGIAKRQNWHTVLNEHGPMIAGVRVPEDFSSYGGRVHSGHNCDENRGHAMLLVGHGIENGLPYWLYKNSHGFYWGEYGYFKLRKSADDKCFMNTLFAKVKFNVSPKSVTTSKIRMSAADKYKRFKDQYM